MAKTFKQLYKEAQDLHIKYHNEMNFAGIEGEVLHLYNNLLNQAPDEPALMFSVATANLELGNNGLAINLLRRCIELAGDSPEFWNNLGSAYKGEHMVDKAQECYEKAISLRECGEYYSNMSTTYINEGDPGKGLEYSSKALDLDINNPKNHWNHALLLLEAGDYENGFVEFDAGLISGDRPNRRYGDVPMYNGHDLQGKTVVVYGEQGIGDEILFASALPDLINAVGPTGTVIYDCHERLENVMRRSFPECEIYPTRKGPDNPAWMIDDGWSDKINYRLAIGSLFRWFGVRQRDPYLQPDLDLVQAYRTEMELAGHGRVIGFGYAGGNKKTHSHARSFKLTPLLPLLKQPANWISLQYTEDSEQKLANFKRNTGIDVTHWPEALYAWDGDRKRAGWDYDNTIAMVAACDLIIVPNTATVHVAGAVGTQCWTLTPDKCAWRYLGNDDQMSWYLDYVKLYRENGNYSATIAQMAIDLEHFV